MFKTLHFTVVEKKIHTIIFLIEKIKPEEAENRKTVYNVRFNEDETPKQDYKHKEK